MELDVGRGAEGVGSRAEEAWSADQECGHRWAVVEPAEADLSMYVCTESLDNGFFVSHAAALRVPRPNCKFPYLNRSSA